MIEQKWEPNAVELDIAVGWFLGVDRPCDDDERELFYQLVDWLKGLREEAFAQEHQP
jgi:hypothetical protein